MIDRINIMAKDLDFHKVKKPGVAVDVILLTIENDNLKIGLIKRKEDPYFGKNALPGRFVRYNEKIIDTAKQALKLKGNIDPEKVYLKQLHTFGNDLVRDTRIRTISIVYYGLVPSTKVDFGKDNLFTWHSVYDLPKLAFDHERIIKYALEIIRDQLFDSQLVFKILPKEFTLTELQNAFELILDSKLDKRNFRKKINELYILKSLDKKRSEGAHRPAVVYSFVKKK
jgi:8-oxo-dGTP diphosphatase